jgi:hypothetical protein
MDKEDIKKLAEKVFTITVIDGVNAVHSPHAA